MKLIRFSILLLLLLPLSVMAKWEGHSPEAVNLLTFMEENSGKKMLSAAMANVNYNTYEADWVNKHVGKYPAINCFDYIHDVFSSAGGWIDYGNTKTALSWNEKGGVIAAMWHWNQKANDGKNYSFYCGTASDQTSFKPSAIFSPVSAGYQQMIADIDRIANWMKPLAERHIPILWRPLHEAQGNWSEQYPGVSWHKAWFWWGADGPEAFVELWQVMYDRMVNYHGLTNLIWVFTAGDSMQWYPGDEYVDVVGSDCYNMDINQIKATYNSLKKNYPGKLVALAECGNVPKMSEQWKNGVCWNYFMPWYDYDRTKSPGSSAYNSTSHQHANIDFWKDALACDFMLSRGELPDFSVNPDAIEGITIMPSADNAIYNMAGQRVNTVSHGGLYIINNHKVFVKGS